MFIKALNFFKPPEYENIEMTQKARFLHISLLVCTGAFILLGILNMTEESHLGIFLFIMGGLSLLGVPANKHGFYNPVAVLMSGLILVSVTYSLLAGVGLKDAGLVAYPIYIIFTSYLLTKKAVIYATLLSIASIALVYFLGLKGMVNPIAFYSNQTQLSVLLILFTVVGFLLWVVVDNWDKTMKNLRDTYDLTLAGWGQALEFRDHETEGHSQRVVEMTLDLARRLNVSSKKLEHIRRGALLHDIGKMAIPDSILLKPGHLSEAEWEIVRKHPVYARKMLESIPYLKAALEIPYSHHEKWDGSGYPDGLTRENIPFAARIFTVVDVWDALTSERPYRQAWSEEAARQYILDQSGKQFDPQVVKVFLELAELSKEKEQSGVGQPAAAE